MDLTGITVAQYHLLQQIGQGGMATVYKAHQPSLDRYVAIKVLKSDLSQGKGFVARFEREARAIARLRHRNILTIFDYGHINEGLNSDIFYLVMEHVSGGTLRENLGWPQDLAYAANMITQVGGALAHAHRQGMIHRDVKPSNVLLIEEDWPVLSDFGLVKMLEDSQQLTLSGASVGTPQYMSPEQAQGRPVDPRSDIYSLGVILYELVTGQPPFGLESAMALILKHINDPVTPPHDLRSDLPPDMERVILKALAKDPEQRYPRMEDFLTDLNSTAPVKPARPVPVEPAAPPPESKPVPTPQLPPPRRKKPKPAWTQTALRVLTFVALVLTIALYRDVLMPLAVNFIDLIAGRFSSATSQAAGTQEASSPDAGLIAMVSETPSPLPATEENLTPTVGASATAAETTPVIVETPVPPTPSSEPSPEPPVVETRVWEKDGAEMVRIPAGPFSMGSDDLGDDERPVHRITLNGYWIDRYEITNAQFARFVEATGYQTDAEKAGWGWVYLGEEWGEVSGADWRHPRGPDSGIDNKQQHPVVLVSWHDADAYCRWAGKTLPTEAQWEKAARGPGDTLPKYPWGNTFDPLNANVKETGLNDTTPVGTFSPQGDSVYGAADMTGNVWEWVADWYDRDAYANAASTNPTGPTTGTYKILRGGSWLFDAVYARAAFRYNVRPDYTYDFTGFRCSSEE